MGGCVEAQYKSTAVKTQNLYIFLCSSFFSTKNKFPVEKAIVRLDAELTSGALPQHFDVLIAM